ncbi:MAG: hypothetical protein JNL41_16090 [Phenylobacterium sp.]|uniref:hypothetical protein n=1 Tax=Phenylobacterium sp. TaxID=1871053 RepID=UPI001A605814|nr:hypothetical protein [Phenylobacterium sp.]MBL8555796.1 hypothetical protein [Phenylobacterium sp.]
MSRIDRIRRAVQARSASRTEADTVEQGGGTSSANLPVAVGPVPAPRSFREDRRRVDSEFAAQVLGQDGQRRGLRAGPGIHDIAQAAYNRVEWSGSYDRRARKGRQARTDI